MVFIIPVYIIRDCKCKSALNVVPMYCKGSLTSFLFWVSMYIFAFLMDVLLIWLGRRDIELTTEFLQNIFQAEKDI